MHQMKCEIRDGMKIDWDAPIAMDDGVVLRADVFRPVADGKYPVILSYGPYAKGLAFQEGYKSAWTAHRPRPRRRLPQGSSNKYQNWELFDPEKWVPDGYALVRVDSRGAGRSPGYLDVWSPREAKDIARLRRLGRHAALVERQGRPARHFLLLDEPVAGGAAAATASGGAVHLGGLVGLLPRALPPRRHPVATSWSSWYPRQVTAVQHGVGDARRRRAPSPASRSPGPTRCPSESLQKNRADCDGDALRHRLIDDYYRARLPKFEDIEVPLLSAANWGGMGLHPRGNFEGYLARRLQAEVAGGARRHALHAVLRQVRPGPAAAASSTISSRATTTAGTSSRRCCSTSAIRARNSCRAPRTNGRSRARNGPSSICTRDRELRPGAGRRTTATLTYETHERRRDLLDAEPMTEEMEITGPVAAKLFVSSDTTDADLFLVLRRVRSAAARR